MDNIYFMVLYKIKAYFLQVFIYKQSKWYTFQKAVRQNAAFETTMLNIF